MFIKPLILYRQLLRLLRRKLGKVCSNVQPILSSCVVHLHTVVALVAEKRALVPCDMGTRTLGAPYLATDFSMMMEAPSVFQNEKSVHSYGCKILLRRSKTSSARLYNLRNVGFWRSAFEILAHAHVCVTSLRVMLRVIPPDIYFPYLANAGSAVGRAVLVSWTLFRKYKRSII
jgi:hypothetical protein